MPNLINKDSLTEQQGKDKVIIHVMPRRFHPSQENMKKAKSTGLIIIFSGIMFLILILVFVYFYFFRQQNNNQDNNQTAPILNINQESQQKEKNQNTKEPTNIKKPSKDNLNKELKEETVIKTKNKITASSSTASSSKIIKIKDTNNPVASSTVPEKTMINISDKDKDGISDREEILLGCDLNSADTDKDGYNDKQELDNLYNPAGTGKIENSSFIRRYNNESYQYSFLLPVSLSVKKFGGDDSLIINLSQNEFIQIIIQPNKEKDDILTWYQKQFNRIPDNQISFNNWQGIRSDNNFIIYLSDNDKKYIVTINYNSGIDNLMTYANIFDLIIKSFRFDYD